MMAKLVGAILATFILFDILLISASLKLLGVT
jgi:hypothetical protein